MLGVLAFLLVADWASIALEPIGRQPDTTLYHDYAIAFVQHHQLPLEYPALSIALFLLTLAPPLAHYEIVFGAWMLVAVMVAWAIMSKQAGRGAGLALLAYLVAGAAATVLERFDVVPALCVLGAWLASRRGRWRWSYLLLGLGTLLKLFPVFLVPLLAAEQFRTQRTWRGLVAGVAGYVGVVVAGFGLAALADPAHAFSPFRYAGDRPLDVSSAAGSLLWLGSFFGWPVHGEATFASYNLVGAGSGWLEGVAVVAFVLGWVAVFVGVGAGRLNAGRAWIACLCVLILTSKVFSAQYLIWVFPLVAAVEGVSAIWLAVALMTSVVFPVLFTLGVTPTGGVGLAYAPGLLAAVAVRNVLLVVATVGAIRVRPESLGRRG